MGGYRCRTWFLCLVVSVCTSVSFHGQQAVPAELTLEKARALLLAGNPLLQAEELGQEIASSLLVDLSRRPNPELSVNAAGLGSRPENGTFLDNQEFAATVSYELETAGKRRKRTRLARHAIDISTAEYQDRVRLLSWELKQRYYRIVLAQREVELAREFAVDFRRLVNLTRVRYQNGEVSGRELRRIEAEEYRFQEAVISAEVLLENAQDRLLALIGYEDFGPGFRAVDGFAPSLDPPSLVRLRQAALASRKDLEAQQERIARAGAELELEQARGTPNWRLFGGYRRDFGNDGAIVGVNLPLFVFNDNEGTIASVRARQEQERLHLRDFRIRVFEEVQLALNELEGQRRRLEALTSTYLEKTRQARDISETAYRLGSVPLLEFLDAQRSWREALRRHHLALYELQIGWARLELAVGRDLP